MRTQNMTKKYIPIYYIKVAKDLMEDIIKKFNNDSKV